MKHVLGHPGDVSSLHTLNAVSKFKSDRVPLANMQNVIGTHVGNVNIYVLSVFGLDMAVAGFMIKPFYGSCEHGKPPFEKQNIDFFSGINIRRPTSTIVTFIRISGVFVHRFATSI
jgi:hypothetical protein